MIRILSVAVPVRVLTLVVVETALLFACYFLAVLLDPDIVDLTTFVSFDSGVQRIAIVVFTILVGMYFRNLYSLVRAPGQTVLVQELLVVIGAAFMGQGLIHYLNAELPVPRKVMLIGSPLVLVAIWAWRRFFDAASTKAWSHTWFTRRGMPSVATCTARKASAENNPSSFTPHRASSCRT